jgi:hypothetical protein
MDSGLSELIPRAQFTDKPDMFDVPHYRIRAYLRGMRSKRKLDQERAERRRIHFKRVSVELKIGDGFESPVQVIRARAVLNDLRPDSFRIFTSIPLQVGLELGLILDEPRYFYVRAVVESCHELPFDRRILSQTPCHYRVRLRFEFRSREEAAQVSRYQKQLFAELLYLPAKRGS